MLDGVILRECVFARAKDVDLGHARYQERSRISTDIMHFASLPKGEAHGKVVWS